MENPKEIISMKKTLTIFLSGLAILYLLEFSIVFGVYSFTKWLEKGAKLQEASPAYKTPIIANKPSSMNYSEFINQAKKQIESKTYKNAVISAGKAYDIAKNNNEKAIAKYWSGYGLFLMGGRSTATEELESAIAFDPTYAPPYSILAEIKLYEEKHEEALRRAELCIKYDFNIASCHNTAGSAFLVLGQKNKAIDEFKKAVYLQPNNKEYKDNLDALLRK